MLFTMISDRYLRRERAKGRAEGVTEGRVLGFTEAYERWEEWNRRRIAAEATGEEFDEPPPIMPNSNEKT